MKMNGSQILIQSLIDQGVDTIFGYPGGSFFRKGKATGQCSWK